MEDKFSQDSDSVESVHSDTNSNFSDEISDGFIFDNEMKKLICINADSQTIPIEVLDQYAEKTKILDLSGNQFRQLNFIDRFVNLEELILDGNEIDDDEANFPTLPSLHSLMLNKNSLKDIFQLVNRLKASYPELTDLSLLGNEVCPYEILHTVTSDLKFDSDVEYRRYRHLLIFCFPKLKFLDWKKINDDERRMAMKLGDILYSIAELKAKSRLRVTTPMSTGAVVLNKSLVFLDQ